MHSLAAARLSRFDTKQVARERYDRKVKREREKEEWGEIRSFCESEMCVMCVCMCVCRSLF